MSESVVRSEGLPFIVPLLALGTFLMCTSEYIVAGLLQEIAADLGVTLAQTGLLITAFAVGMVVGAPTMSALTMRMPRRLTLVLALLVFALGQATVAMSSSFEVVLVARVITALATGAFWSVAAVVATSAAGPRSGSRALGVMMSGVGLATVLGLPIGAFVGQQLGWRGTFWALAAIAAVSAIIIGRFTPQDARLTMEPLRVQLRALRSRALWVLFCAVILATGGCMAVFSYISPLLTERSGLSLTWVPLVLATYGLGSVLGANVGGRWGDRRPIGAFIVAAAGSATVIWLLIPSSALAVLAIVLLFSLGLLSSAIPPLATGLAVNTASGSPTFGAALSVSAFNGGTALGSLIAGSVLGSPAGVAGTLLVGGVMVTLSLVPLSTLALLRSGRAERRRSVEFDAKAAETVL